LLKYVNDTMKHCNSKKKHKLSTKETNWIKQHL
jgi:hypothetical protein